MRGTIMYDLMGARTAILKERKTVTLEIRN